MPNANPLLTPGDIFAYPSDDPQYYGMTLRDRFAVAALGALIQAKVSYDKDTVARFAWAYADAAISARRPK